MLVIHFKGTRWSIVKKNLNLAENHEDDDVVLSHLHPGRERTPRKKSVEEIEMTEREEMENGRDRNDMPRSRGVLGRNTIHSERRSPTRTDRPVSNNNSTTSSPKKRRNRRASTTLRVTSVPSSLPSSSLQSSLPSSSLASSLQSPKRRTRTMSSSPSATPHLSGDLPRDANNTRDTPATRTPSLQATGTSSMHSNDSYDEDDEDFEGYDHEDDMGVTLQSPFQPKSNTKSSNTKTSKSNVKQYMNEMVNTVSNVVDTYAETVLSQHRGLVEQMTQQHHTNSASLSPTQHHQLSPLRNNRFVQFLLELEVDPLDAVEYHQKLNTEGYASVASIRCSKLKSNDLIRMGIKRGHAHLIISELKRIAKAEKNVADALELRERSANQKTSSKLSPKRRQQQQNNNEEERRTISPPASPGPTSVASLPDPKRFDSMDTATLCNWLNDISLGQYKPMIRRYVFTKIEKKKLKM